MNIKRTPLENPYPVNSTRFILPTVAIRGWMKNGAVWVSFAFWTWRICFEINNNANDAGVSEANPVKLVVEIKGENL